jgi:hypothetical protein
MLNEDEKMEFIRTVWGNDFRNWCPLVLTFTGCEQMCMRQDSIKKQRWCDLHLNNTHAPIDDKYNMDGNMLACVYMPLEHKEHQESKRVVGVWRHAEWEQCYTCMVATVLFYKLNTHELVLNFG